MLFKKSQYVRKGEMTIQLQEKAFSVTFTET